MGFFACDYSVCMDYVFCFRYCLAGIPTGVFRDLQDAANVMITEGATYYPRKEQHEAYMAHYQKYRELYGAVRPLS